MRDGVTIASAGPYVNHLHLTPDNYISISSLKYITGQMFLLIAN